MNIILLIAVSDRIEESNYLRLGNELLKRGFSVTCCFMDSIGIQGSEIVAQGFELHQPLVVDQTFPESGPVQLKDADVVWTLTLGMRHSFLDKIQLLKCLEPTCRLINSLDALVHLKSKYFLANHSEVFKSTYKTGLVKMCQKDRDCIDLIEGHFDECIDQTLVDKMIAAAEEEKTEINARIADTTMKCIEQYLPKSTEESSN